MQRKPALKDARTVQAVLTWRCSGRTSDIRQCVAGHRITIFSSARAAPIQRWTQSEQNPSLCAARAGLPCGVAAVHDRINRFCRKACVVLFRSLELRQLIFIKVIFVLRVTCLSTSPILHASSWRANLLSYLLRHRRRQSVTSQVAAFFLTSKLFFSKYLTQHISPSQPHQCMKHSRLCALNQVYLPHAHTC